MDIIRKPRFKCGQKVRNISLGGYSQRGNLVASSQEAHIITAASGNPPQYGILDSNNVIWQVSEGNLIGKVEE